MTPALRKGRKGRTGGTGHGTGRALFAGALLALCGAACQGQGSAATSKTGTSNTTVVPGAPTSAPAASLTACPAQELPVGFREDTARSGALEPGQYSTSGDMQAAMIFDGYQNGVRSVYTNLGPAPGADSNLVVECFSMQFQTAPGATNFVAAYKALRDQAGNLAVSQTPAAAIGTTTVQYAESGQSFAGYNIASTNIVEMAAVVGARFYAVSVAGPSPSEPLALNLLRALAVQP